MPCRARKHVCLDEDALRVLEETKTLLKRPASYIISDALKLYNMLLKRGYLHAAWSLAAGVPIVVNNNVVNNAPVYNINDLEVNIYAADIEMLRGVFQS
ncbi:hypothetical protein, partial [Pyrobaculum sp.]|uniref:hypothetical protein n=1 Tax=Pyrobaculum sp. TaxID=2004705 RepID=UPI003D0FCB9D